ncbi:hypothetical protein Taro_006792 [Colocasia esculenta]|uniref:S-acyltransferase n=1 Tax=Colocasia esculenta TaxID=4460 RepID=A0A843TX31_COLES|nr:hypothetical protein [Colocasia esculenta]
MFAASPSFTSLSLLEESSRSEEPAVREEAGVGEEDFFQTDDAGSGLAPCGCRRQRSRTKANSCLRNYRFFFMFVSSTTILCLYVFAFCWVNLRKIMEAHQCNLWKAFLKSPISGILILYTFVAAWFVGGLTAFHMYLVCTNQTTYENFRYRYDGKTNPYNRGCIGNIGESFCSKIPKSKNNFRAKVKEDSAAFPSSLPMGRVMSPDMAKMSFDLEMGGKRQGVVAEEFEDIQSQIESAGLERCGTQPPHSTWGGQKGNWETDLQAVAAELGMEHGFTEREKIQGSTEREKFRGNL